MQPEQPEQWQRPANESVGGYAPEESVTQNAPVNPSQSPPAEPASPPRQSDDEILRWQGQEHVHREKNMVWFVAFGVIVLVLLAMAIFWIRSFTFAALIPVMALAMVVYVRRPPALIEYTLSRKGLHVNDALYNYDDFKAFGVVSDGEEHSILMVPRKRFMPGVTLYFPEELGESLVDFLAARLPMVDYKPDVIDRLTRLLRI